jgi:Short C-terminal domain
MFRRPFLRRRRVIGAAMLGGLGYVIGRRRGELETTPPDTTPTSVADRLAALDQIHQAGTITDAEFEAKKTALLNEL